MAERGDDNTTNRRGMLAAVARWCSLAALAGGAAWLIRRTASAGTKRGAASRCARCPALMRCTLPEAESARTRGIGLTTPVRQPAPGCSPEAAWPHCPAGRRIAAAARDRSSELS